MMPSVTRRRLLLGALVLPAACSSPDPKLYTLQAVPGPVRSGAPTPVTLRQISLAHYLERPQIVRSSEDYRVDIDNNNWWGEPLAGMVGRVLVENLSQRLPGTQVIAESGAISPDADTRVEVNILRMDADRNGEMVLSAQVGIARRTGEPATRTVKLTVHPPGPSLPDYVAAASQALGKLADEIADELAQQGGGGNVPGQAQGTTQPGSSSGRRSTRTRRSR